MEEEGAMVKLPCNVNGGLSCFSIIYEHCCSIISMLSSMFSNSVPSVLFYDLFILFILLCCFWNKVPGKFFSLLYTRIQINLN